MRSWGIAWGLPAFPLEESWSCWGAGLPCRAVPVCGVLKESSGPQQAQMKSVLSAEWKRKSIEWLTLILQNQPVRVGFYLIAGTCVVDAGSCLLDNHCVLFQTHSRKCVFTKESLSREAAANLVGV